MEIALVANAIDPISTTEQLVVITIVSAMQLKKLCIHILWSFSISKTVEKVRRAKEIVKNSAKHC